jgi:hypothetical protein
MVRQHALMESLSANLHGFLHQIDGNMSRRDRPSFLAGLRGGLDGPVDLTDGLGISESVLRQPG